MTRPAFTLVELLVVVAIVATLVGVLLPALASARGAAMATASRSNLRQVALMARVYANEHAGHSPALGRPWGRAPFWAVVVREYAGVEKTDRGYYDADSVLRSPLCAAFYGRAMTRCYAINATGHAGLPADPDDFDQSIVHIRTDAVRRPADVPYFIESSVVAEVSDGPPPTRTIAVVDFRQDAHVRERIGWWGRDRFHAAMFDGSVRAHQRAGTLWRNPLP